MYERTVPMIYVIVLEKREPSIFFFFPSSFTIPAWPYFEVAVYLAVYADLYNSHVVGVH